MPMYLQQEPGRYDVEIGSDLLVINELEPILARERYCRMIFTPAELSLADSMNDPRRSEFLAGRFCAKEAIVKLLGTGFVRGVWWRDVEIRRHPSGRPYVVLYRAARLVAQKRSIEHINLTIAHKGFLVIAVAIATCQLRIPNRCALDMTRSDEHDQ